jgi:hypothetical protein
LWHFLTVPLLIPRIFVISEYGTTGMWFSRKSRHVNQPWPRGASALVNLGLSWSVVTISAVAQAETASQLIIFGFTSFSHVP